MSDPKDPNPAPWCYWRRGEYDGALLGFLSKRERDAYQAGSDGPFRRFIRTSPRSEESRLIAEYYPAKHEVRLHE